MTGNKRGSAIVITVKEETEAKKLCASGLCCGSLIRVVEKYWEAGLSSVYMTCYGIGYERMGNCGNRPAKCVICSGAYKVKERQCGVIDCAKSRGKICTNVKAWYTNCGGNHMSNPSHCLSRQKPGVKASKDQKLRKQSEKEQEKVVSEDEEDGREREKSLEPEMKMDLRAENWAKSPLEEELDLNTPESQDYTQNY